MRPFVGLMLRDEDNLELREILNINAKVTNTYSSENKSQGMEVQKPLKPLNMARRSRTSLSTEGFRDLGGCNYHMVKDVGDGVDDSGACQSTNDLGLLARGFFRKCYEI